MSKKIKVPDITKDTTNWGKDCPNCNSEFSLICFVSRQEGTEKDVIKKCSVCGYKNHRNRSIK